MQLRRSCGHLGHNSKPATTDDAYNLQVFADNEHDLYRLKTAIGMALERKIRQGKYDPEKAPKAFIPLVTRAAHEFGRQELGSPGAGMKEFSPDARRELAAYYADAFEVEHPDALKSAAPSGLPKKTIAQWQKMPTLESGHTDSLKFDDGKHRVWVSRMTLADYGGDRAAFNRERMTVEENVGGVWVAKGKGPALAPGTRSA